jgi:D-sedoheptulose 7-phosphate isomerase
MSAIVSSRTVPAHVELRERLRRLASQRFEQSADVATLFMHGHASLIARACLERAERFQSGGRLLAFGDGAAATDARHVAVEFVHPVIVGKRALPALALNADGPLELLGGPHDIAMLIAADPISMAYTLGIARSMGMLTVALVGNTPDPPPADFVFAVPTDDALVAQEVHEHLYHVLWELVHVFLENRIAV